MTIIFDKYVTKYDAMGIYFMVIWIMKNDILGVEDIRYKYWQKSISREKSDQVISTSGFNATCHIDPTR